jgi:indolepyruvate ferredoxin oxidoreductase beta subunit
MNIVVLGAAISKLGFGGEEIENSIKSIFARKGDNVVEANINALRAGMNIA